MPILSYTTATFDADVRAVVHGRAYDTGDVSKTVQEILQQVRAHGDSALRDYTQRFDGHALPLAIAPETIAAQAALCPPDVTAALELAASRIRAFHVLQYPKDMEATDALGVRMGVRWSAIDSVGLYVPGGRASYPSSVLMNAIPAIVAGVKRLVLCVPMPKGYLNPAVLAAAKIAGITEIYGVGGAQAIAALAYGTANINAVDKIVGPGNAYVAEAKRQVYGTVGIDSIAGPSEVLILADETANPQWLAWDILAQSEHDPKAQSLVITDNPTLATAIDEAVTQALQHLPATSPAHLSWKNHGAVIVVKNLFQDAPALANQIAAEHLQLCVAEPEMYMEHIRHAGSIFLGHYTPEALGDYLAGPNHVLPTMGTARFSSGLSVTDFMKRSTWLSCPESALAEIGTAAVTLATSEGLKAHAESVRQRLSATI